MTTQITPEIISRAKFKVEKIKEDEADKPIIQTILDIDNIEAKKKQELEEIERKLLLKGQELEEIERKLLLKGQEVKEVIRIKEGIIDKAGLGKANTFSSKTEQNKFEWDAEDIGGFITFIYFLTIGCIFFKWLTLNWSGSFVIK